MRDRLADCSRLMHLVHMTPQQRVETWLESKARTRADFGVRLHSIDFELLHYSAGVSFRVMDGREHYSYKNRTRRICCFLAKNLFSF